MEQSTKTRRKKLSDESDEKNGSNKEKNRSLEKYSLQTEKKT